jgi:hypothetical protein
MPRFKTPGAVLLGVLLSLSRVGHGASNTAPAPGNAVAANQTIELDLATIGRGVREKSISPGTYEILVKNLVPKYLADYSIQVHKLQLQPPPLALPTATRNVASAGGAADPCEQPKSAINDLLASGDESKASTSLKVLQAKPPDEKACADQLKQFKDLEQRMTESAAIVTLAANEAVEVTISRGKGDEAVSWDVTYSTDLGPTWVPGYGFTFIPNRDDSYSSRPAPDGKSFTIAKNERRASLNFAPAILYTYAYAALWRYWKIGPTAGLGFDLSSVTPTVFLGASLVCNVNLQIAGGVVMHQQQRLLGQYNVGDNVGSSLTNAQLTDKTYRPNAFFGITLNLSSNPFKPPTPTNAVAGVAGAVFLTSLTLKPPSVVGGKGSTGTVTLTGPAPAGGTAVTLSSDAADVAKAELGTVTIAAGSTSAPFTVTTFAVSSTKTVTITGSCGGTSQNAKLTVTK